MPVPPHYDLFLDPNRCIGCRACVQACSECDTHKGHAMIHLEYVDRAHSTQTVPVVCMHCETPTCAEVCPADAIKKGEDGIVRSALKARCVGCSNCVLACPFGVPKMNSDFDLMMKCDLCYDRTSVGRRPMCATVCPSGALFFGTAEEVRRLRPRSRPANRFQFGDEGVATRVQVLLPRSARAQHLDVLAAMDAPEEGEPDAMLAGLFGEEGEA
ncbi:MAG TPA: 4Fe-4S dicluster domain-containing protein [Gemmataceae bacterium]|jgi:Fe-S-cluster-containing dehydrogenase component|nr:4Fe-4S dicluster domain-containing protein [Gemmataceae bacterium]